MEVARIHLFSSPITTINLPTSNFTQKRLFSPSFSFSIAKLTVSNPSQSCFTAHSNIITASSRISTTTSSTQNLHWMVILDKPPQNNVIQSKPNLINYYVTTLLKALPIDSDEKEAQRCIYDACCDNTNFGFCCVIDKQTSQVLAGIPGVLAVKPDPNMSSVDKDYSYNFNIEGNSVLLRSTLLFPDGSKNWLVRIEKPSYIVSSKAQMVDFYVDILAKVLGNEKDAQMCLYHTSWQSDYGFCCVLDERCAQELAAIPGVLSVQPDENFESEHKYYGGGRLSSDAQSSAGTDTSKTKLFITGLSFYTSEKTLRAAFEPFGELVEVKVIMDKISKRSKGYAFVEYSTEDAAMAALQEMNGKIINGWMIVVDVARSKPRVSRGP